MCLVGNLEKTCNRSQGDDYLKIALISNPTSRRQKPDFPPPGIAYLGATAYQAGHEVHLIDGGLRITSQITQDVRDVSPDLVGVTCWTIDRNMVWKLCAALKEAAPKAFLVLGGPHATMYPEDIFKKTHASAVIVGEGEETFAEFLEALVEGKDLKDVAGLVLRTKGGGRFTPPLALPSRTSTRFPVRITPDFGISAFCTTEVFRRCPVRRQLLFPLGGACSIATTAPQFGFGVGDGGSAHRKTFLKK